MLVKEKVPKKLSYVEWTKQNPLKKCYEHIYLKVQKVDRTGRKSYYNECQICGHCTALEWHKTEHDERPPYRNVLAEREREHKQQYNAYLLWQSQQWEQARQEHMCSETWKEKRKHVIKRCNNVCEGCGIAPVDDIHHVEYTELGDEFLFQLMGLCRECHSRWHSSDTWRIKRGLPETEPVSR